MLELFYEIFSVLLNTETATYAIGYKLTLRRNTDNTVLNKNIATNNAKIIIKALEWS